MSIFQKLIEEGFSITSKTNTAKEQPEESVEEIKDSEDVEELPEENIEQPEVSTIQDDLQDICYSILDAVEAESLAQGEVFDDGESPDVAIELIIKLAPTLTDEQAKLCYDTLSEYFDMEIDESTNEETEDFFEPAKEEISDSEYEEDLDKKEK